MDTLIRKGKQYCMSSLKCARDSILQDMQGEMEERKRDIRTFFKMLKKNVCDIFDCFDVGIPIKELVEDSLLSICLSPDVSAETNDEEIKERREGARNTYRAVQKELDRYRHIIYRIKSFIVILS
ncbi:MAG: hypothetical protein K2H85_00795, partial [Allobaculum sp.]|nr:hypothetical protein [Allobaculum sp.]